MKYRVLHVWNTAGVASVIAKFVDRSFPVESMVATRRSFDRFGLTTYGVAFDDGSARFALRALSMARRYDLVQVHSLDGIVPWIKRLYPAKPVIMHYHGADIIGRWGAKEPRWSRADLVAYSTPDLAQGAPAEAVHMPNPVDTDLFHPMDVPRVQGSAISRHYGMDREAESEASRRGLSLGWMEKVPLDDLPLLFSKTEFYIDFRKRPGEPHSIECLGKAALEALACGCRAIGWDGAVFDRLPTEHEPKRVADRWNEVYLSLIRR